MGKLSVRQAVWLMLVGPWMAIAIMVAIPSGSAQTRHVSAALSQKSKSKLLTCPFCGDRFPSLKEHVWAVTLKDGTRDVWTCDNAIVGKQVGEIVATDDPCGECPAEPEPKEPEAQGPSFQQREIDFEKGTEHTLIGSGFGAPVWVQGSGSVIAADGNTESHGTMTFPVSPKTVCPYCGLDSYPHLMQLPVSQDADGVNGVYWETCSVEFGKAIQGLTRGALKSMSPTITR